MSPIIDIFLEYKRMRNSGMEAEAVLDTLHQTIATLNRSERRLLAEQIHALEQVSNDNDSLDVVDDIPENMWTRCPRCNKLNQVQEYFCYACGQFLDSLTPVSTRLLPTSTLHYDEYFDSDSLLFMRVLDGSDKRYESRPQLFAGGLIVGRSMPRSPIKPHLDLSRSNAEALGVSRFHLKLIYDDEHKKLLVKDLGSTNGSYINGRRIDQHEVLQLSTGDDLQLGKLPMRIAIHHPKIKQDTDPETP